MDRQLHRCNIQITNYASKIGSTSVINVVKAIISGETTAGQLEKNIHGRIKNKHKEKIAASLTIWNALSKYESYREFVPKIDPKQRLKKSIIIANGCKSYRLYKTINKITQVGYICGGSSPLSN